MRDIKFRVWDGKKFLYTELATRLMNDQGGWPFLRFNLSNYFDSAYKFEIQQYTGLKDVDGREIYEGDIVYVNGRNRAIEWRNGGFYCTWSDYPLNTIWFMGSPPLIVGNIFEHSELLVSLDKQIAAMQTPESKAGVEKLFKNLTEEELPDLDNCPQCNEKAWNGRICHICGAKKI